MDNTGKIKALLPLLLEAKGLTVLTGSGVSAECGIPTFRGEEGLWKTYRAEELATPSAFKQNPKLVWEWYNWRRELMAPKEPHPGHTVLAEWETTFPTFTLITQNIDGLHQKAGSKNILELHGNIWKMRCTQEGIVIENREATLKEIPPLCPECGALLRPHVVWFGESLDMSILHRASLVSAACDVMFVVGTSAVVQPAASLPLTAANGGAKIIEVNPEATPLTPYTDFSFRGKAGDVLSKINTHIREAKKGQKD